MADETFPRYSTGQRLDAETVNRHSETLERHDRLSVSGGLGTRQNGTGISVVDEKLLPFEARITDVSGGKYGFIQETQFEGGVFSDLTDGISGTPTQFEAYERSGNAAVPIGTHVVMYPQAGGAFYVFDAGSGGGIKADPAALDDEEDALYVTPVNTIATQDSRGLHVGYLITSVDAGNGVLQYAIVGLASVASPGDIVYVLFPNRGSSSTSVRTRLKVIADAQGTLVYDSADPVMTATPVAGDRLVAENGVAALSLDYAGEYGSMPGVVSAAAQDLWGPKAFPSRPLTIGLTGDGQVDSSQVANPPLYETIAQIVVQDTTINTSPPTGAIFRRDNINGLPPAVQLVFGSRNAAPNVHSYSIITGTYGLVAYDGSTSFPIDQFKAGIESQRIYLDYGADHVEIATSNFLLTNHGYHALSFSSGIADGGATNSRSAGQVFFAPLGSPEPGLYLYWREFFTNSITTLRLCNDGLYLDGSGARHIFINGVRIA